MEETYENLFLSLCDIEFGEIRVSAAEIAFFDELNHEIVLLCKSLPESTQADALLFLMHYFRIPIGGKLNFYRNYHAPAWSILYWIDQCFSARNGSERKDFKSARTAHALALLLHSLDDHLNDGQLPVSHLTLLLRGQAWMVMNNTFMSMADHVSGGHGIVHEFLNDYYVSICSTEIPESLEIYCTQFRKQMATGVIAPRLLMKNVNAGKGFTNAIETAYGSFGIAWRLLDDIKDLETDMMKGMHSAVYICLPDDIKNSWDAISLEKMDNPYVHERDVLDYILESNILDRLRERIYRELQSAANIANDWNITGLGNEFRCLAKPLQKWQAHP